MTSPSLDSRQSIISSPVLRKHSQADNVIYGQEARTRPRTGDSLNLQRLFKWSRSPNPRFNNMIQLQHPPAHPSIISLSRAHAPAKPLTDILLEHQPYLLELATRAPFLIAAGAGHLSKDLLSKWLSQRRLYAQALIGFIGALISRVDLPYAHVEDKKSSIRWRIVQMLSSSLENIQKNLKSFEDVAKRYNLDLEFPPRPGVYFTAEIATKHFVDLFRAFWTDPTMTLLEGLIVLWATEYCQLTSWRYAKSHLNPTRGSDLDGGALRNEFIPSWTNNESEKSVNEITECTNLLADRDAAEFKIETFRAVWVHVLGIERKFWSAM
jgi:thiaminase